MRHPDSVQGLRLLGATAVAALVFAGCGGGRGSTRSSASQMPGDKAAASTLAAAARATANASSFAFDSTVTVGPTKTAIAGTYKAPDRVHQTVTVAGGAPTEAIFVGARAWVRPSGGTWASRPASTAGGAEPTAAFAALTRAQSVSADGGSFRFTLPAGSLVTSTGGANLPPTPLAATATVADGRIVALGYRPADDSRAGITVSVTYRDFDVPVTIEPPA